MVEESKAEPMPGADESPEETPPYPENALYARLLGLNRIQGLTHLADNWDSYHANKPTPEALDVTRQLVEIFAMVAACPPGRPEIMPTPNGGVQVKWHRHGYNVEINIDPQGGLSGWTDYHHTREHTW